MNQRQRDSLFLQPGDLLFLRAPTVVTTVLGSCVAVTMHAPDRHLGGICHAVLPRGDGGRPGKYVDRAIAALLEFFAQQQVRPGEITAKLFGGACLFGQGRETCAAVGAGAANVAAARASLAAAGLCPAACDTGGSYSRKLIFHSPSGAVFIKRTRVPTVSRSDSGSPTQSRMKP